MTFDNTIEKYDKDIRGNGEKKLREALKSKKYVIFTSIGILRNKYKIKSKISSKLAKDSITIYKR